MNSFLIDVFSSCSRYICVVSSAIFFSICWICALFFSEFEDIATLEIFSKLLFSFLIVSSNYSSFIFSVRVSEIFFCISFNFLFYSLDIVFFKFSKLLLIFSITLFEFSFSYISLFLCSSIVLLKFSISLACESFCLSNESNFASILPSLPSLNECFIASISSSSCPCNEPDLFTMNS